MRSSPHVARTRWGVPWEEQLLDRAWPAFIFVLLFYGKAIKFLNTLNTGVTPAHGVGIALFADLAHQTGQILVFAMVIALYVIRRPALGQRSSLLGAMVALAGTGALGFLAAVPPSNTSWQVLLIASAFITVGVVITVISLATLGRCFGLFPEARGLVTHGPYRYVRHPVYLGEFISGFGLLIPLLSFSETKRLELPIGGIAFDLHLAYFNAAVFLLFVGLQLWRSVNEEKALEAVFPEYAQYRQRTWRVLPGVF